MANPTSGLMPTPELSTARRLRELELEVIGLRMVMCPRDHLDKRIAAYQFENETGIYGSDFELPPKAAQAIRAIWAGRGKHVTLEDLAAFTRWEIAGLNGVGPKAMAILDAEFKRRGLKWEEETDGAGL